MIALQLSPAQAELVFEGLDLVVTNIRRTLARNHDGSQDRQQLRQLQAEAADLRDHTAELLLDLEGDAVPANVPPPDTLHNTAS